MWPRGVRRGGGETSATGGQGRPGAVVPTRAAAAPCRAHAHNTGRRQARRVMASFTAFLALHVVLQVPAGVRVDGLPRLCTGHTVCLELIGSHVAGYRNYEVSSVPVLNYPLTMPDHDCMIITESAFAKTPWTCQTIKLFSHDEKYTGKSSTASRPAPLGSARTSGRSEKRRRGRRPWRRWWRSPT